MQAVRKISPTDVPAVVAACEWLFEPPASRPARWDPNAAAGRVRALCDASTSTALVAEHAGEIVGCCTVYLDLVSIRLSQRAWINELAVHHAYRSRGIGARLLGRARQWARDAGASYVLLDASTSRVDAHRFYERHQPEFRSMCFGWMA